MQTPWGAAQGTKQVSEGIVQVWTASHGGYRLSKTALEAMPEALRNARTYAGAGWYEEDCDWALVALAFPQHFGNYDLLCAVETAMRMWDGKPCIANALVWLREDPRGIALYNRVAAWRAAHGCEFRVGGQSTGGRGWRVYCTNIADTERIMAEFPEQAAFDRSGEPQGVYALRSPFPESRIAELGGQIVKREPVHGAI